VAKRSPFALGTAFLIATSCGVSASCPRHALHDDCAPRLLDAMPWCRNGRTPAPDDRVTELYLNGPETGGDQGQNVCFGLLLELGYASGLQCNQRIGSFASIGMGDEVWVDDEPVCLRLAGGELRVERNGVTIAKVPERPGMDTARSGRRCAK
jgi:hypothetical protein